MSLDDGAGDDMVTRRNDVNANAGYKIVVENHHIGEPDRDAVVLGFTEVVHVRDVMTTDVVTVGPEATYDEVVHRMLAHGISGLPVTDTEGTLVGIVTETDLVIRDAYGSDRRRPVGPIADYLRDRDQAWVRKASGTTARELMTPVVATASPDDELHVTARRMVESGYRRLPVLASDGRLVGVVSRRDLLAPAYARAAVGCPLDRDLRGRE
jgi:CBS domain-containing protein